jgi:Protein of unknown function (DUF433)
MRWGQALHSRDAHHRRNHHRALASGRSLPEILAAYPYLEEEDVRESLSYIRLDRRFDEIKSGLVKPVSGEEVFERLRRKSEARRSNRASTSERSEKRDKP